MTQPVSHDVLLKIRKLAQLADDLRRGESFEVTRLTSLKGLCREPSAANRFVTYLARKTLEHVEHGRGRSGHPNTPKHRSHRQMMAEALPEMEAWVRRPTEARRQRLWDMLARMQDEQNEYKPIPFGSMRLIDDWDLVLFEDAVRCLLGPPHAAPSRCYQIAREYAERYDPRSPHGLARKSAPLVQDIADFWAAFFNIDLSATPTPAGHGTKSRKSSGRPSSRKKKSPAPVFTHRQGQFLAFIHLYRKLHRQGPGELDMVKFFRVTPPSVHGMVVRLEELRLVTREPGVARSVRVAIPEKEIPELEEADGPRS